MQGDLGEPREKCYKCMRASSACICEHINPINTKTRFVILMHPMEYRKEKNGTGRMTNLQLKNSEIIVGVDFTHNKRVNEILVKENSFLLYPGKDNFNLSFSKSSETKLFLGENPHLFILDGTWPCARKMLKLSKNLQELTRVSFDPSKTSNFIFKQQPEPLCLSTIESTHTILNILNDKEVENCDTNAFLLPFEKMVEQQIRNVLNPNNKSYRSNAKREITPKNMYKKRTERNIIFEERIINKKTNKL